MTVQTIDTNTVKQNIDLRTLAAQHTTLRRASGEKELCGPCPRSGCTASNDGFYVQADFFACRKCHPDRGDAIEFMQWLHNVPFKEAVAMLAGAPMPTVARRAPEQNQAKPSTWDTAKASKRLHTAQWALWDNASTPAHDYLEGRGLTPDTWLTFGLGFVPDAPLPGTFDEVAGTYSHPKQPAIVLPWYAANQLVGLRYRFMQSHTYTDVAGNVRTEKQTAARSSGFAGNLFGGQAMTHFAKPTDGEPDVLKQRTLVICEGEINAMSIYQVAHATRLDVLSLGSESQKLAPKLIDYAQRYGLVILWADRDEVAEQLQAAIPSAYAVTSAGAGNMDANDLLRADKLGLYLSTWRFDAASDLAEQEALYYNLSEACAQWHQTDDGTRQATQWIGQQFGA